MWGIKQLNYEHCEESCSNSHDVDVLCVFDHDVDVLCVFDHDVDVPCAFDHDVDGLCVFDTIQHVEYVSSMVTKPVTVVRLSL